MMGVDAVGQIFSMSHRALESGRPLDRKVFDVVAVRLRHEDRTGQTHQVLKVSACPYEAGYGRTVRRASAA
ncbi:hypothetical protein DL767_011348 [Monosporascus sp. MG133]|nr:hypothetical protein DL767_011348 [Monosporascus sp. MG133]